MALKYILPGLADFHPPPNKWLLVLPWSPIPWILNMLQFRSEIKKVIIKLNLGWPRIQVELDGPPSKSWDTCPKVRCFLSKLFKAFYTDNLSKTLRSIFGHVESHDSLSWLFILSKSVNKLFPVDWHTSNKSKMVWCSINLGIYFQYLFFFASSHILSLWWETSDCHYYYYTDWGFVVSGRDVYLTPILWR